MTRSLKDTISLADADGGNSKLYPLLSWEEQAVSDDNMPPGEKVIKKTRFWSGMGERQEMGRGGYFYSENAAHNDPFALKPRPSIGTLTLTDNTNPVERFFEATDGTNWYLYCLAAAKAFKVKAITTTPVLAETKNFTTTGFYFASGKYLGDGKDNRQIKGVGFAPDAIILKSLDDTTVALLKTSTMGAYTKKWSADWDNDDILSLDTDGFTVSDSIDVNNKATWFYWQAWKADGSTVMKAGSYTGDGNDSRQYTDVGFQPDLVHIGIAGGNRPITSRSSSLAGDKSFQFYNDADVVTNRIQDFIANGFELGDDLDVNESGSTYHYVAFKAVAGAFAVGTYSGNGGDDRSITGFGFAPTYATVVCESAADDRRAVQASHKGAADITWWFYTNSEQANHIQAFEPDGIQVGSSNFVNRNGSEFHWMAWRGRGAIGKPAPWNRSWRVPLGTEAGIATLQKVYDESGAGDDTWVVDPIPADHLQRLRNKLARARDQYVSLVSADDIGNRANWGAAYGGVAEVAIGAPDVEITDLVEWGRELAVCATDGMYMFDGVATTEQQLPLLGGLTDADNGKGTLRWGSYILYPSADGLWRWRYGEHRTVGPDSIPGYGPAQETSNEPVNLKHYGLTFCGDHIYEAAYDGTNYLLIHYRPVGDGFIPDCLLSTTSVIKVPYVDRNRYLWFGYGNNLAYIKLSQGGEPDGGNFGNASLVTTIYEREIILADDAEVRLRMIKAIVRNMDVGGADTYKWELHASRDGAAFGVQIGADIEGAAMNGVNKRYWTAASNLRARRLRIKEVGTATAGYTPTTTAPEIIALDIYGETVPDDAEIVKAVINLDKMELPTRSAKAVYTELKARENAGVVQVRHPILDTVLNMIIYRCELTQVKQKGYEDPIGVVILYLRHGDTS